jgi:cytochrome P450
VVTNRRGLKLHNGQVIPYGTTTAVRAYNINTDPKLYPNPHKFDPFRFSRLREVRGSELKYQHGSTSTDFINFGHGLWACPGRFFAAAQLKTIMAYLLMNYDMKLKEGETKPLQNYVGMAILPNSTQEVLFKKRDVPFF